MKKVLIMFSLVLMLLVGCGKNEKEDREELIRSYSKDYYVKFMNKNLTNPVVTLDLLKKSNEVGYTDYDLSKFEKCKDTSSVELILKEDTNEIEEYKLNLDCE